MKVDSDETMHLPSSVMKVNAIHTMIELSRVKKVKRKKRGKNI